MTEFRVGQKLWHDDSKTNKSQQNPGWWTIEKVGRQWLTVTDNHRVDKETLRVEGSRGQAWAGRCWLTQEACEEERVRRQLWRAFCERVEKWKYNPPDFLNVCVIYDLNQIISVAETP